jgi:hypothetical protein
MKMGLILHEKDPYNLQEYLNIAFGTVQHHILKRTMILIFEEFVLRHQICLGDDNIFYLGEAPLFSKFELRFSSLVDIYCMSQSWQKMCYHLVNLQIKAIRWNLEPFFFLLLQTL